MNNYKVSLEAARVNAKMSQDNAAKELGISRKTLFNWENGKTSPTLPMLAEISKVYSVPIDAIFIPKRTT